MVKFHRGDKIHKSLDVGVNRASEEARKLQEMYEREAQIKIEHYQSEIKHQIEMQKEMLKFQMEIQKASVNAKLS